MTGSKPGLVGGNAPSDYPTTLELKDDQLPEITSWQVGSKYKILVEVEMKSLSKAMPYSSDAQGPEMRATFKVLNAKSAGASTSKTPPPPASRTDRLAVVANKAQAA